jgi:hypothetical protein
MTNACKWLWNKLLKNLYGKRVKGKKKVKMNGNTILP